jgi:regulator of chromosome condensation
LNSFGQTGYAKTAGKDNGAVSTPMKVASLSGKNVTSLDGGAHHSAAVTQDGKCYIWGRIDGGQLGIKFTDAQIKDPELVRLDDREKPRICLRPTEVPEVGSAVHVGCGTEHTVVVNSEGVAYSTGFGTQGQLGLGSYDDIDTFQQIPKERVKGKKLTWSGAGGQFSIVAAPVDA